MPDSSAISFFQVVKSFVLNSLRYECPQARAITLINAGAAPVPPPRPSTAASLAHFISESLEFGHRSGGLKGVRRFLS